MSTAKNHMRRLARDNWRLYDGWVAVGRHVRQGEKSVRRNKDGRPIFHIDQTDVTGGTFGRESDESLAVRPDDSHFFPDYCGDSWGDQG